MKLWKLVAALPGLGALAFAQTPSPTPARAAVDALNSAELLQAVQLLKSNYVNPDAVNDVEIARATLQGLLARLGAGAVLIENSGTPQNVPPAPFYSELLAGHMGYLRCGDLTKENLAALDAALGAPGSKKPDAAIVDLRASNAPGDFEIAAEFAKRFCAKGKPLFSLRKGMAKQERSFVSEREPLFTGIVVVLADGDTSGGAEALAAALRANNKALVIGAPTAGRAVEYSDQKLSSGKSLRIASGEVLGPDGHSLFPGGVQPDLRVDQPLAEKREIFVQSRDKGMAPFIFEAERPHMNEAALIAGRNPEVDAAEAAQRRGRGGEKALHDPVAQRAVDVVTSIGVYQKR
jgi:hypothetical protein